VNEARLYRGFRWTAMALQFDVETIAEQVGQPVQALNRIGVLTLGESHIDGPFRATGVAKEPGEGYRDHPIDAGPGQAGFSHEIGERYQAREVGESLFGLSHEDNAGLSSPGGVAAFADTLLGGGEIDRKFDANQRLDALLGRLLGEFERTEQIVGVGY